MQDIQTAEHVASFTGNLHGSAPRPTSFMLLTLDSTAADTPSISLIETPPEDDLLRIEPGYCVLEPGRSSLPRGNFPSSAERRTTEISNSRSRVMSRAESAEKYLATSV